MASKSALCFAKRPCPLGLCNANVLLRPPVYGTHNLDAANRWSACIRVQRNKTNSHAVARPWRGSG
eukprot:6172172-Lingulodinium_polyedra.AAC.1